MRKITIWQRFEKDRFNHNHIEDGFSDGVVPKYKCEFQEKSWKNGVWKKEFAFLNEENVVVRNSSL